MTHASDALTISSEHRLKKRNEELETGQAQEIELLRQRDAMNTDAISALSDKLAHIIKEIDVLKQERT